MGKASGRPKCKLCEHEHWSHEPHVFGKVAGSDRVISEARSDRPNDGRLKSAQGSITPAPTKTRRGHGNAKRGVQGTPIAHKLEIATSAKGPASSSGRTSGFGPENPRSNRGAGTSPARKDYLKKKAVERRKREREEADKLGLTVKAYRATKRKQNDGGKDQQLQTGQNDG